MVRSPLIIALQQRGAPDKAEESTIHFKTRQDSKICKSLANTTLYREIISGSNGNSLSCLSALGWKGLLSKSSWTDLFSRRESGFPIQYVCNVLLLDFTTCWPWRDCLQLVAPRVAVPSYGERAFSVAAARLWNGLPVELKSCTDLVIFKKLLKTFLFRQAFWEHRCCHIIFAHFVLRIERHNLLDCV